jgi:hypothetical protein
MSLIPLGIHQRRVSVHSFALGTCPSTKEDSGNGPDTTARVLHSGVESKKWTVHSPNLTLVLLRKKGDAPVVAQRIFIAPGGEESWTIWYFKFLAESPSAVTRVITGSICTTISQATFILIKLKGVLASSVSSPHSYHSSFVQPFICFWLRRSRRLRAPQTRLP